MQPGTGVDNERLGGEKIDEGESINNEFWRGKEFIGVGGSGQMLGLAILAGAFETAIHSR